MSRACTFRYAVGKTKKPRATLQMLNFDPRHPNDRAVNSEAFTKLYESLKTSNPSLGFSRCVILTTYK